MKSATSAGCCLLARLKDLLSHDDVRPSRPYTSQILTANYYSNYLDYLRFSTFI